MAGLHLGFFGKNSPRTNLHGLSSGGTPQLPRHLTLDPTSQSFQRFPKVTPSGQITTSPYTISKVPSEHSKQRISTHMRQYLGHVCVRVVTGQSLGSGMGNLLDELVALHWEC